MSMTLLADAARIGLIVSSCVSLACSPREPLRVSISPDAKGTASIETDQGFLSGRHIYFVVEREGRRRAVRADETNLPLYLDPDTANVYFGEIAWTPDSVVVTFFLWTPHPEYVWVSFNADLTEVPTTEANRMLVAGQIRRHYGERSASDQEVFEWVRSKGWAAFFQKRYGIMPEADRMYRNDWPDGKAYLTSPGQ